MYLADLPRSTVVARGMVEGPGELGDLRSLHRHLRAGGAPIFGRWRCQQEPCAFIAMGKTVFDVPGSVLQNAFGPGILLRLHFRSLAG